MAVVHVLITGTKEEVLDTRRALTRHASDRRLYFRQISPEMCQHLGVDIWDICVSKAKLDKASASVLRAKSQLYPKMIWRVSDKHGVVQSDQFGLLTNFPLEDADFPGPFGRLCRNYGKPYWGKETVKANE